MSRLQRTSQYCSAHCSLKMRQRQANLACEPSKPDRDAHAVPSVIIQPPSFRTVRAARCPASSNDVQNGMSACDEDVPASQCPVPSLSRLNGFNCTCWVPHTRAQRCHCKEAQGEGGNTPLGIAGPRASTAPVALLPQLVSASRRMALKLARCQLCQDLQKLRGEATRSGV